MGNKDKKMSNIERGKILWARLLDIEKSGQLYRAESRKDLAEMVEWDVSWVGGLIHRGFLTESIHHYNDYGAPVYRYALTGKTPDYSYAGIQSEKARAARRKTFLAKRAMSKEGPRPATVWIDESLDTVRSIEITRGDTTIRAEVPDWATAIRFVTDVLGAINGR